MQTKQIKKLFYQMKNHWTDINFFLNKKKYILSENRQLENSMSGKRCFIIGNAPSLKNQDLSLLKDEFVITVNQITRNPDFPKMKTNMHFWADPLFFLDDIIEGNNEFLKVMESVNTVDNTPICFYPVYAKEFVEKHKLNEKLNIRYFFPGHIFYEGYSNSIDFSKVVPGFNTVVQYAIILAIYMGMKEIYLLGCDCTGIISYIETIEGSPKKGYAYNISETESSRMKRMHEYTDNESVFMGHSIIFKDYKLLNNYCKSNDIKLVNCSGAGILKEVPYKSYKEVIQNLDD